MLNERSRRRFAATEALLFGAGGIAAVVRATGISLSTVRRGLEELSHPEELPTWRMRRPGGGRKRATSLDPSLATDLERLVEPTSRGDPESRLRWTPLSTRNIARELQRRGHRVSHSVVANMLHDLEYSLQAPRKSAEGKQHPDRNAQFEYINACVARQQRRGEPAISVDTKKKETVGNRTGAGNGVREAGPRRS